MSSDVGHNPGHACDCCDLRGIRSFRKIQTLCTGSDDRLTRDSASQLAVHDPAFPDSDPPLTDSDPLVSDHDPLAPD